MVRQTSTDHKRPYIIYFIVMFSRSQWPRGLRCGSTAARFLGLWVRIPPGAWMSVLSVVCCQVEVSATGRSLVQKSPTECDASLCVAAASQKKKMLCLCILIVMYVLFCVFCFIVLFCVLFCVNVNCATATGCQPSCSSQIYQIKCQNND